MDSLIIAIITNIKNAFGNVRFFPALLRLLYNYRGEAPGSGEPGRSRRRERGREGELGFAIKAGGRSLFVLVGRGGLARAFPQHLSSWQRPGSQEVGRPR